MRTILTIIIAMTSSAALSAENTNLTGIVVEQRATAKSYESWHAPSDPYYILDMGQNTMRFADGTNSWARTINRRVILRASESISTEMLSTFTGKTVTITGYLTEGTPYQPSDQSEQYPIVPNHINDNDENPITSDSRPANRGRGFIVEEIREMEDTEHAPPAGRGEAPRP